MSDSSVRLVFTADGSSVRSEIDADITALNRLRSVIDSTNTASVAGLQESIAAERAYAESVGASELQLGRLDKMQRQLGESAGKAAAQAGQIDNVSAKWRTGASAAARLAFAADGMGTSMSRTAISAGMAADAVASLSGNAALAAGAAGIGALAIGLGAIIAIFEKHNELIKAANDEYEKLIRQAAIVQATNNGNQALAKALGNDQALADVVNAQEKNRSGGFARFMALVLGMGFGVESGNKMISETDAAINRNEGAAANVANLKNRGDVAKQEKDDSRELANNMFKAAQSAEERYKWQVKIIELSGGRTGKTKGPGGAAAEAAEIGLIDRPADDRLRQLRTQAEQLQSGPWDQVLQKRQQILSTETEERIAIDRMTFSTDRRLQLENAIERIRERSLSNLDRETRLTNTKNVATTQSQSDNVQTAYEGRLKLIHMEMVAEIQAGVSVVNAEASAQQKIQQLRKETLQKTVDNLSTIEQATINSHNRQTKGIGEFAKNAKAVLLAFEAKDALVKSIKAFAHGLDLAAGGDFGGAALAAASGVEYAAAATLAASEAGGGGGGSSGGGGGSSGSGGGQQASSRVGASLAGTNGQTQTIEIVFVSKDSTGKTLSRTRQQLQRLQDRNQPIRLAV